MAAKKTDAKADKPKKGGGGIMALLPKIFGALAFVSAAVLFAATFDVGHMGLPGMVAPLAVVPISIFMLFGLAYLFMGGGKAGPASADNGELGETVSDFQTKTAARFAQIQNTLDAMSGRDYDSLVEENRALKEQLDAIHEAAREKVDLEIEALRNKNQELEERIKAWAVQTVDAAMAAGTPDSQEAA